MGPGGEVLDGMDGTRGMEPKPATAARIYDYFLGGVHNFVADREAAEKVLALFPDIPVAARANRAFLRRAVRYLADAGVRQFLDIGSGIPTEGNVHEVADQTVPDARVAYVDIDPVAVAESQEILVGHDRAIAICADLRSPQTILDHPRLRRLLDLHKPVGLLLIAVLHFVADDEQAYGLVDQLTAAMAPGSYLVVSHAAAEIFAPNTDRVKALRDVFHRQTSSSGRARTRSETERFFTGNLELVDPGVVWLPTWQPALDNGSEFADEPQRSALWAGVGKIIR